MAEAATAARKPSPALAYFDDLTVGETNEIGSYHFTAENIIRFAKSFDPQPFHIDPEAAAKSHFGALCASGWHTGAACMRQLIDRRMALARSDARARPHASGDGVLPRLHGSRVAQAGLCGRHGQFREHARLETAERLAAALGAHLLTQHAAPTRRASSSIPSSDRCSSSGARHDAISLRPGGR